MAKEAPILGSSAMIDELSSKQPATLFFMHIPKTAGTTVSHILREMFEWPASLFIMNPMHSLSISESSVVAHRSEYRLVHGHFHRGFVDFFCNDLIEPFIISTFREPIARTLSALSFVQEISSDRVTSLEYKFGSALNEDWFFADNLQTRFLLKDWKDKRTPCTREDLEEAKEAVRAKIHVVGLHVRFDELMRDLGDILGYCWKGVAYNRSIRPLRLEDITSREVDLVRGLNQFDVELYDWIYKNYDEFKARNAASMHLLRENRNSACLRINGPEDGDFIQLQTNIDIILAQQSEKAVEIINREDILQMLELTLQTLRDKCNELDTKIGGLGDTYNALMKKCIEAELKLVDRNQILAGRKRFESYLAERLKLTYHFLEAETIRSK